MSADSSATIAFSFGWRRPMIVLPDLVKEKCSPDQVRIILRHELVHIVRRDFQMNLLQKLTRILFVYNPLIHLSDRLIDDAREMICDQEVLKLKGVSRKAYASTLLHMNEVLYPGNPLTAAVPFYRKFSQLKGRIIMIKNTSTRQTSGLQRLFIPIILLFSFAAITLTALQAAEDKKEQIFESNDQKVKMTSTYVEISKDGQENRYGNDSAEYLMWQKRFSMMEISNEELLEKEAAIKANYEADVEQKRRQLEEQRVQLELLIEQVKREKIAAQQSMAERKNGSEQLEQDQQALREMQQKTTQVIDELQRRVMELSAKMEEREKSGVKSIRDK
ncbi:MAG: M56 family metallopeptidase, partial [Calditrichota bacterium]